MRIPQRACLLVTPPLHQGTPLTTLSVSRRQTTHHNKPHISRSQRPHQDHTGPPQQYYLTATSYHLYSNTYSTTNHCHQYSLTTHQSPTTQYLLFQSTLLHYTTTHNCPLLTLPLQINQHHNTTHFNNYQQLPITTNSHNILPPPAQATTSTSTKPTPAGLVPSCVCHHLQQRLPTQLDSGLHHLLPQQVLCNLVKPHYQ